jgi:hypothetical protein
MERDHTFYKELVNSLRNEVTNYKICIEEQDTLKKCILCKKYMTDKQWSVLLEKHIKEKFNIKDAIDTTSGDGCSKNNLNIEIKVSLGGTQGKFNFVQIRPGHKIDYYLFLVYNLFENDLGSICWLLCKSQELYALLPKYGGYAHGTTKVNGSITNENIYGNNLEYALRPDPTKNKGNKSRDLWDIMKEKFCVNESEINTLI